MCRPLNEEDRAEPFYADSAYQTPEIKEKLADLKMPDKIVEKGDRNNPLIKKLPIKLLQLDIPFIVPIGFDG